MIQGAERVTYYNLFEKVDPYDVYCHYLGYKPELKKMYLSPFRPDSNGSFGLRDGDRGELVHNDFGDSRYHGNCINFVQQLFGIDTVNQAVKKIVADMGLEQRASRPHTIEYKPKEKEPTLIQIVPRKFTASDISYWNQYGINTDDLKREDVYSVKELYINKQRVGTHELVFAYLFTEGEETYVKVYQPFSIRAKWLSSVPVKKIFNLDKLEGKSNIVTIAKSKKDKMVLNKLITDIYEVQKEGAEVISHELDSFFDTNYDRKVCFFDNDEPGKRANVSLNARGYGWVNIPNYYYLEGIKDPSDLVRKYGYKVLEELLVLKGYGINK